MPFKKRFLIISGYYENETYGLLGPQMAATIIEKYCDIETIVIGVCREFNKDKLKKEIYNFFNGQRPIIGFSTLLGREELFLLAKELKEEGCVTILAGPQSLVDYIGEKDHKEFPYRFKGYWDCFDFAIYGPAEQIIPFLLTSNIEKINGVVQKRNNSFFKIPKEDWKDEYLSYVNWNNLYRFYRDKLEKVYVSVGQIVHHIGCPYAKTKKTIKIDYPSFLTENKKIDLYVMGCSFCDVAKDKGFWGKVSDRCVLKQLNSLPEKDGRKIPFEIINENPIPFLPKILDICEKENINISQINLTLRADWFVKNHKILEETLKRLRYKDIKIFISSIGFESFDDKILKNLNKGTDVKINLQCVKILRSLKEKFFKNFFYSREDGAIHGFIHPTPWDDEITKANIQKRIFIYQLMKDILPHHSTPLIIHHSSFLADWIRYIEKEKNIYFLRKGNIIHWWNYKCIKSQ